MDGGHGDGPFLARKCARWNLWNQRRTTPHRSPQPGARGRNPAFCQIGLADQSTSDIYGGLLPFRGGKIPEGDTAWRGRRLCFDMADIQVLNAERVEREDVGRALSRIFAVINRLPYQSNSAGSRGSGFRLERIRDS